MRFTPAAVVLVSLAVAALISLVSLVLGAGVLCVLPAAASLCLLLGLERMRVKDEERTFLLLCSSGDKLAAESIPAFCATEEVAVLGRRIREVVRIKKVGFVTGYFARMKQRREGSRAHTVFTLASLFAIVLTTILYAVFGGGTAADTLSLAAWLTAPLSAAVLLSARRVPYHHLVELAGERGTAVLGDVSAEEYGSVDAIAFEDVEAFRNRGVELRGIKLYGEDQDVLPTVLGYLSSIFAVLGGPLDTVFSAADVPPSNDVVLLSTAQEGLDAAVDGVRVTLGKWGHFRPEQIAHLYDKNDAYKEDCGETSILYVAVEGRILAKIYLCYTMNAGFEDNVRRLQKNGVHTLVRSYDPSVTDRLLSLTAHATDLRIRAVRKTPDQLHDFAETRVDSGLVTSRGSLDLLYSLFLCQNYRKAVRRMRVCRLVALPLSLLPALLLPLLSGMGFFSVYGAAIGLIWLLPTYFISRYYFRKER